eukprot:7274309-Ditylum_brightwellii.AAC.1
MPYWSGLPIDAIYEQPSSDPIERKILEAKYCSIVGSLNWLVHSTCPDLVTVTNLLPQHQSKGSKAHLVAAKYDVRYLAGSKCRGIQFRSKQNHYVLSYVKFPVKQGHITAITDAKWGPQDQTITKRQFCKQ